MRLPLLIFLLTAASGAAAQAPSYLGPKPRASAKRVITLAPSLTEIVLALDAGERLKGVSRYDDDKRVKSLPRVGGFLDPSPESILALRPDLVIAQPSPGNKGPIHRLAKLGVPILVVPLHSVPEVLDSIREVAKALGAKKKGAALVEEITAELATIEVKTRDLPRPRVLVVYGWRPLVVAGPGSFADALLRHAGGQNVASSGREPYPVLSAEAAIAAAPDLVLDAAGEHEAGKALPVLAQRVVRIPGTSLFRPGPRLIEGVRELVRLLHPTAAASSAPTAEPASPPAP